MKYLFLLLPVLLVGLSIRYHLKFTQVRDTGKISEIISAKQNTALLLVLAGISLFVFFAVATFAD
ncbi:hypothetical protein KXD93_26810 [Mucilaginibacter sp. BJC16-A38]|uniref:hypothetical protein n=1 Tax=Mucilaginibacter phenanthrenivorans TaxID=1234842 RepID=UPI0021575E8B|nr:hypothetical protein [Mucilaginibacter phenanthrenivorans]MCR8561293.1 hypothetical protein [Mucilaginibacter phenanthrenivorans]